LGILLGIKEKGRVSELRLEENHAGAAQKKKEGGGTLTFAEEIMPRRRKG